MSEFQNYTLALFSRNRVGILNRITSVFSRIKLNIDSLNVSETENTGVYRYSINVNTEMKTVKRITKQLAKQVDVIQAYFTTDDQIVQQEVALYKIPSSVMLNEVNTESIIRSHNAKILSIHRDYAVIEKTGLKEETQKLFDELQPFGILEFVRSGPISISKPNQKIESLAIGELKPQY